MLLFVAGFNLMLLELLVIRELSIPLFCTELVILLVTVAYFSGHLLGYAVYSYFSPAALRAAVVGAVLVHLPLIPWVRLMAGALAKAGVHRLTLPLTFLVVSVFLTSLYAMFLPLAIESDNSPRGMARSYTAELSGAIAALLVAFLLGRWFLQGAAVLYLVGLLVVAWCLEFKARNLGLLAALALLVCLGLPRADRVSAEYFYSAYYQWFSSVKILHSEHSPYQKIEVLEDQHGKRSLYLNGLEYFSSGDLEHFNYFLSGLPASLKADSKVLVVGSGSMSSLRYLAPHSSEITTVELDARVTQVGRQYFADFNKLEQLQVPWRLVIDDAKHFLATTDQQFDLIIIDVPAPYYLQTGLLFTREFYELAAARLNEEGVLSAYLCEWYEPDRPEALSGQILAAIEVVFADYLVVDGSAANLAFVMAAKQLPFDSKRVVQQLRADGYSDFQVFGRARVQPTLAGFEPAGYSNLNTVWELNRWALER